MRQGDIARLLVKITGLIVIAYALIGLPNNMVQVLGFLSIGHSTGIPTWKEAAAMPQFWGMSFAPFIIYLAIGVGLLFWGERLVETFIVRSSDEAAVPADFRPIEEVAIAVLGLYFLAEGLADLSHWWASVIFESMRAQNPVVDVLQFTPLLAGIIGAAVRVLIGAALAAYAKRLVSFRRRMAFTA